MKLPMLSVLAAGLLMPFTAVAKDKPTPPLPAAYSELIKCKDLSDPTARLACYDEQVAQFAQATASGQIVIADKESVRETRRGLFGFNLPHLGLFGGDDEEFTEINTTIARVGTFGYGSWRITLADGAVWEQTDTKRLVFDPKPGQPIRIREAALGSFMVNIDGQHAIKMRRIQ